MSDDRVSAGELRSYGYVFDPKIPDQATVRRCALDPVLLPRTDDGKLLVSLRVHEPFTWLDLTFVVSAS